MDSKYKPMRTALIFMALLMLPLATVVQSESLRKLKQMEWLLGNWTRTNARPGKSGFERWTRVSDTEWKGRGISLTGSDTTFVEKLRIVIENDKVYYVAEVPGNAKPVYFELTTVTPNSFVCENPSHDFPKRIAYEWDGQVIRARVSSGDQGMDYVFKRSP